VTRTLGSAIFLGVVYCLTLSSTDPVDFAMGAGIGGALTRALGSRLRPAADSERPPLLGRVAWFPLFIGAVLAEVVQGTWDVALRVLHLRPLERPGVVRIPIGERSERGVGVSALATTLSPGTVLIDIDDERRDLLLHVIDASDPDAVRARLQRFYDRYQRKVFP